MTKKLIVLSLSLFLVSQAFAGGSLNPTTNSNEQDLYEQQIESQEYLLANPSQEAQSDHRVEDMHTQARFHPAGMLLFIAGFALICLLPALTEKFAPEIAGKLAKAGK